MKFIPHHFLGLKKKNKQHKQTKQKLILQLMYEKKYLKILNSPI